MFFASVKGFILLGKLRACPAALMQLHCSGVFFDGIEELNLCVRHSTVYRYTCVYYFKSYQHNDGRKANMSANKEYISDHRYERTNMAAKYKYL